MGAISGFTGPPDERLGIAMSDILAHRGGPDVVTNAARPATMSLRPSRYNGGLGLVRAALHDFPERDLTVALCGYLIGIDDDALRETTGVPSSNDRPFYAALADAFMRDGIHIANQLRGGFVLVVRDGQSLHIVRDGAGCRTVYYAEHDSRWLFAIEPKAITRVPGFRKTIRPAALAQYLSCSFVPGSGTMLENLWELPAGHAVRLEPDSEPTLTRWYHFETDEPEREATVNNGDSTWTRDFSTEMQRAVEERMPHNEPFGVFLSGGLDSSVITAELARQIGGRNVRTWALHFGPDYPNELEFARSVAERCGTDHREVLVQPRDFLPRLRRMIWHLDDPIGDPITQPNFELASHVSGDVKFIFNGEGGDPCFGGPKNLPMMLHHWYGGIDRERNFRERCYLHSYRRAWEEIEFLLSDDVRQALNVERDLEGVFTPYLEADSPRLFLNRLTSVNIREKGAHLILPKVERMLGAHDITPLAPLFDERLVRFSFRMPARCKLDRGIEKVVLKRAYENDLPKEVIDRPKSGMRVPVHYWFKSEMRRYVRHILSPRSVRRAGLFNPERVRQLLSYNIEEGRGRYGLRLWMLTTFELWRRIVVEGESV
ncbi:MAG: asparagine synthase-related protein [Planctomycetaceae bacterium]